MRFQTVKDAEWVDIEASGVTPELQVLLKQRLRDAEIVGWDPKQVTLILLRPDGAAVEWRALP